MVLQDKTLNKVKIRTKRLPFSAPILTHNTALSASVSSHCTSQTTEEGLFYPIITLTIHNPPWKYEWSMQNICFYSRSVCFGAPILTYNTASPSPVSPHCTSQTTEEDFPYPIITLTVLIPPENTIYQYKICTPTYVFTHDLLVDVAAQVAHAQSCV